MMITIIGVKFTIHDPFYFEEEGTDRINHLQLMTHDVRRIRQSSVPPTRSLINRSNNNNNNSKIGSNCIILYYDPYQTK